MKKHILKLTILTIWAVLMVWWWQESRSLPAPIKIDAAFLADYSENYSLMLGDRKIGWAFKNLERLDDGSYRLVDSLEVLIAVGDQEIKLTSDISVTMDKALNLEKFFYIIGAGPVKVSENGEVKNGVLTVKVNLGEYADIVDDLVETHKDLLGDYASYLDFKKNLSFNIPKGPILAAGLPSYIHHSSLKIGENYTWPVFDPLGRSLTPVIVKIEEETEEYDPDAGRKMPVKKIKMTAGKGQNMIWLDRFGRLIKEENSLGLSLTRADTQEIAQADIKPLEISDKMIRLIGNMRPDDLLNKFKSASQKKMATGEQEVAGP